MAKLNPIATLETDYKVVRDILLELIDANSRRHAVRSLELLDYSSGQTGRAEGGRLWIKLR